jgi:hypothetical protein
MRSFSKRLSVGKIIFLPIIIAVVGLFLLNFNSIAMLSAITTSSNSTAATNSSSGIPKTTTIVALMRPPFPDQQSLVNMYKSYLTSNDYVITYSLRNLNFVNMLPGFKVFGVGSVAQIQNKIASLKAAGISTIGFDLEHGSSSVNDMVDPVSAIHNASLISHHKGLKLMPIPGFGVNTPEFNGKFAPFADVYVIQAEAHQQSPAIFKNFVTPIVKAIRSANPNIKIIVEVSVKNKFGQVSNVEQCYSSVADIVDGVTVWYGVTPDQLVSMNQVYAWVRSTFH